MSSVVWKLSHFLHTAMYFCCEVVKTSFDICERSLHCTANHSMCDNAESKVKGSTASVTEHNIN